MWKLIAQYKPPQNVVIWTKIDDQPFGERNVAKLQLSGNLWFFEDGSMYVYYTPTHWKEVE